MAVLGPGIRGPCSLIAARQSGAEFVLVTDNGQRNTARLAAARRFGADVVDAVKENPAKALLQATGRGADIVIDVTAKALHVFQ